MQPYRLAFPALALAATLTAQGNECSGALSIGNGNHGPFTNVGATTS